MSTIILVDPVHIVRNSLKNKLVMEGYHVFDFESLDKLFEQQEVLIHANLLMLAYSDLEINYLEQIQEKKTIPIVLMTGGITKEELNIAMSHGVIDFILQPVDHEDIVLRITKILPLSSVTISISDLLENEVSRAKRGKDSVSLMLLNVEGAESFTYSESIKLLKALKEESKKVLRTTDMIAEFGNKLMIILPMTPKQGLKVVLQRLLDHLSTYKERHNL